MLVWARFGSRAWRYEQINKLRLSLGLRVGSGVGERMRVESGVGERGREMESGKKKKIQHQGGSWKACYSPKALRWWARRLMSMLSVFAVDH